MLTLARTLVWKDRERQSTLRRRPLQHRPLPPIPRPLLKQPLPKHKSSMDLEDTQETSTPKIRGRDLMRKEWQRNRPSDHRLRCQTRRRILICHRAVQHQEHRPLCDQTMVTHTSRRSRQKRPQQPRSLSLRLRHQCCLQRSSLRSWRPLRFPWRPLLSTSRLRQRRHRLESQTSRTFLRCPQLLRNALEHLRSQTLS